MKAKKRIRKLQFYKTDFLINNLSFDVIMIPIKVNNINSYKFELKIIEYNNFIDSNDFSNLMCPNCKIIGQFERNTTYERNLTYIEGESFDDFNTKDNLNIIENKIKIFVIKCISCNKYHALLPIFIFPYHIYSAYFILFALVSKIIRKKNLQILLDSLNISHKLFYYWAEVLYKYIPSAIVVLETSNNDPPNILNLVISNLELFLNHFYEQYIFIFFLNTKNHLFN